LGIKIPDPTLFFDYLVIEDYLALSRFSDGISAVSTGCSPDDIMLSANPETIDKSLPDHFFDLTLEAGIEFVVFILWGYGIFQKGITRRKFYSFFEQFFEFFFDFGMELRH
jgi:hypothetical protein